MLDGNLIFFKHIKARISWPKSLNRIELNSLDLKVISGDVESRYSGFTSHMFPISQSEKKLGWMHEPREKSPAWEVLKYDVTIIFWVQTVNFWHFLVQWIHGLTLFPCLAKKRKGRFCFVIRHLAIPIFIVFRILITFECPQEQELSIYKTFSLQNYQTS